MPTATLYVTACEHRECPQSTQNAPKNEEMALCNECRVREDNLEQFRRGNQDSDVRIVNA
jgi:hypothetical protein